MAHFNMWYQGQRKWNPLKCSGVPDATCPQSLRIAGEYMRGFFTLTNVLNPNLEYDNLGYELPIYQELAKAKVGDYIWQVLVPPMHTIVDVFLYNKTLLTPENSTYASFGGITLTLITGTFKAADANGDCPMTDERTQGTLTMPEGAAATQQFFCKQTPITNPPDTWTGVGFKIDALPANKTLADIVGAIVTGAHVMDYDAQTFM